MNNRTEKMKRLSIIFLAAGYGWAGGHYIPQDSNFLAYGFQILIICLIAWLGIQFERFPNFITVFAILTLVLNILNIIHGAMAVDRHSYGSHNTLADLIPILLIITGSIFWLLTTSTKKVIKIK